MNRISIVIPAYNEEKRIADTIHALRDLPDLYEVLVVDDASRDETALRAERAGARVVTLKRNRGKGGALNYGLSLTRGEIIGLLDADLGNSAGEVRKLLEPVVAGKADMTIGVLPPARRKAGFGLVRGLARWGIRCMTGFEVSAPLSGQRVLTRSLLDRVMPLAPRFGVEVGLTIDAARLGARIMEVEVLMFHEESGRDWQGFYHRGKQFWDVTWVLLQKIMKR
ncbi:glycosyltransferase family 2 protein [Calderihabitans maritimus]|uniref:Glucosyl-3-phosphoglycerate synthase n=1 Tax=Calderihabitans maritimus TaxID=1246530 RepID=A0A1Z5HQT1_9FIRM|nr:glycosyltransferase family 2 protein [Calderihabitans maritimus]GAW91671.1 family 2 glycosyl transferase [Calderihabitans maritimus]